MRTENYLKSLGQDSKHKQAGAATLCTDTTAVWMESVDVKLAGYWVAPVPVRCAAVDTSPGPSGHRTH